MSDTKLPDEVVRLLNDPAAGGEQAIQPLFTVDDQGCPHATLSSARQWWPATGAWSAWAEVGEPGQEVAVRLEAGASARTPERDLCAAGLKRRRP